MLHIEILDGPNKLDLMLALFDFWLPNNQSRSVIFKGNRDVGEQGGYLTDNYEAVIGGCRRITGQEVWGLTGRSQDSPRGTLGQVYRHLHDCQPDWKPGDRELASTGYVTLA